MKNLADNVATRMVISKADMQGEYKEKPKQNKKNKK